MKTNQKLFDIARDIEKRGGKKKYCMEKLNKSNKYLLLSPIFTEKLYFVRKISEKV